MWTFLRRYRSWLAREAQAAREEAGLSQRQVARRCGVARKTVQDIEAGFTERPHEKTLRALAECYGKPSDFFLHALAKD